MQSRSSHTAAHEAVRTINMYFKPFIGSGSVRIIDICCRNCYSFGNKKVKKNTPNKTKQRESCEICSISKGNCAVKGWNRAPSITAHGIGNKCTTHGRILVVFAFAECVYTHKYSMVAFPFAMFHEYFVSAQRFHERARRGKGEHQRERDTQSE